MSVAVHIPGPLRESAGGRSVVEIARAGTLSNVLEAMFEAHPELRSKVMTDQGEVRRHVNVFVGSENVRHLKGLDTPVAQGGEVSIVPAVSGG